MTYDLRRTLSRVARVFSAALLVTAVFVQCATAQVLVGNPFVTGFQGWQSTWTGTPQVGTTPNWSVLLTDDPFSGQKFLIESSDGRGGDSAAAADGKYTPFLLINTLDTTPTNYTLSAQMATVDNDGFGLVFGYQDNSNYFRVGFREQASNLGFARGVSVQKIVGGVITQLGTPSTTFTPGQVGVPFEAKVIVTGTSYNVEVASTVGGAFNPILSGSDPALAAGKYGLHSWGQREVSTTTSPQYGSIYNNIKIDSPSLMKTTDFTQAIPIPWRRLTMINSFGETGFEIPAGTAGAINANEDYGNFSQDFLRGTIFDDSNGNINATAGAANIDFMGPAVVVNTPTAGAMTNYRYTVRVTNHDNDGIGLLFRVSDTNDFYRVNWNSSGPAIGVGTAVTRPPNGMSVQKFKGGIWSEIYRDDQTVIPAFLPAAGVPFDVAIQAVGNQFKIDLINDPSGTASPISYGVITDTSGDPILAGSVGFTNWGNGDSPNLGAVYSPFEGNATSLVTGLSGLVNFGLTINRGTGNVMLVNSSPLPSDIREVKIVSIAGALDPDPMKWKSITRNYDEAPQDGSVDIDDPWSELTATIFELKERENSGGNGGTLTSNETVDLGNIWRKSKVEDLQLSIELANGDFVLGPITFTGGPNSAPYSRSDLDTDGDVDGTDWDLYFPNMLSNMSALSAQARAIKGDLDLDGDNDGVDFAFFKADYDLVHGAGAFNDMLAGVPEPSTVVLLVFAAFAACSTRSKRLTKMIVTCLGAAATFSLSSTAQAVPLDFTTFETAAYPHADSDGVTTTNFFPVSIWTTTATNASHNQNADSSVLHTPANIINKRITGTLNAGADDDVVGFVVGFEPGEQLIGSTGEYFLIDWKGATQSFDVFDFASVGFTPFHNLTGPGIMPAGLALSRVTGSANGDELWQHKDLALSPTGGVTELARGRTLGSSGYAGARLFDIAITDHEVFVKVDGVEQFAIAGNFAPGRFGLYSFAQGPTENFSDFDIVDFEGSALVASVDRASGTITLKNPYTQTIDFDFYQLSSASNSLKFSTWNSLHDQNFQTTGPGTHQQWQEAGGASNSAIGEVFLDDFSTFNGAGTRTLGVAYNNFLNGEDLVFQYRLPTGETRQGYVEYIGTAPGIQGDFNDDGKADAADYVLWRKNVGQPKGTLPHDPSPDNPIGLSQYNLWRSAFGNPPGSGSELDGGSVPEPASIALLGCVGLLLAIGRRRTTK